MCWYRVCLVTSRTVTARAKNRNMFENVAGLRVCVRERDAEVRTGWGSWRRGDVKRCFKGKMKGTWHTHTHQHKNIKQACGRAVRSLPTVLPGAPGYSQDVQQIPSRRPAAAVSGQSPAALHVSPSERWGRGRGLGVSGRGDGQVTIPQVQRQSLIQRNSFSSSRTCVLLPQHCSLIAEQDPSQSPAGSGCHWYQDG